MGLISKFRPAREQAEASSVFLDLDKLISEPQTFRLRGKVHAIKPISTHVWFLATAKLSEIDQLHRKPDIAEAEFVQKYAELFGMVCDTVKPKDVQEMTNPQRGALLQFVLDCIRGRAQADEKKKTLNREPIATQSA